MNQHSRIHIGFRTLKTAVAVIAVYDVIATVAEDIPNISKMVADEVNSFVCMVSEWSGSILSLFESMW